MRQINFSIYDSDDQQNTIIEEDGDMQKAKILCDPSNHEAHNGWNKRYTYDWGRNEMISIFADERDMENKETQSFIIMSKTFHHRHGWAMKFQNVGQYPKSIEKKKEDKKENDAIENEIVSTEPTFKAAAIIAYFKRIIKPMKSQHVKTIAVNEDEGRF